MPYISHEERDGYAARGINELSDGISLPGQLNYVITKLVLNYMERDYINYSRIALVTGVLENVKQEFYRRFAAPYEDKKKEENGDVY